MLKDNGLVQASVADPHRKYRAGSGSGSDRIKLYGFGSNKNH